MSVNTIAARKLGYASTHRIKAGRKSSKPKEESRSGNADLGEILGEEDGSNDIFANINGGTLSYVSEQIKKQRKRREHQRAKSTVPEAQPPLPQSRNTHREVSHEKEEDKISEIQAYQEETERYSSDKPQLKDQLQYAMSLKYERQREQHDNGIKRSEETDGLEPELEESRESPRQPPSDFIGNLTTYITRLEQKQPRTGKTTATPTPVHHRKTPMSRTRHKEDNSIDLQLDRERHYNEANYQEKYRQQRWGAGIVAKDLQRCRRLCEQKDEHIARLEDKLMVLKRQYERMSNFHQLEREKFEDLRQFIFKASGPLKNDTFEVFDLMSPKVHNRERRRRESQDVDALEEEYRDFQLRFADIIPKTRTNYYSSK